MLQADLIHLINEYYGSSYELETPFHQLFDEPVEQQLQRLRSLGSGDLASPRGGGLLSPRGGAMRAAGRATSAAPLPAGPGQQGAPGAAALLMGEPLPEDSDEDDESYSASGGPWLQGRGGGREPDG